MRRCVRAAAHARGRAAAAPPASHAATPRCCASAASLGGAQSAATVSWLAHAPLPPPAWRGHACGARGFSSGVTPALLRGSDEAEEQPAGARRLGLSAAAPPPLDRRRAALAALHAALHSPHAPRTRGVHTASAAEDAGAAAPVLPTLRPAGQAMIDANAMHAVHTAIGCNVAILAAKLGVYALSGSSSILSESIHSLADIANQTLLRTGIMRSARAPDERSNYGYRRELFVWSLISGVGIFCLGAGVSVVHGLHGLVDPAPVDQLWASLSVIGLSMVIESYSLAVAYRALASGAAARRMPLRQYVAAGLDPTSLAVVAEDGGAVLGLALAGGCLLAAGSTGNPMYDAMGSVAVGSLLGCIAAWLIQTNRRALVGRSLGRSQLDVLLHALRADVVVADVLDAKSEEIGPGVFRFKAEIEFAGDAIVSRYLAAPGVRDRLVAMFAAAGTTSDGRAMDAALAEYGRGMVTAVGDEVDRLEATIMALEPSIRHVDIETN